MKHISEDYLNLWIIFTIIEMIINMFYPRTMDIYISNMFAFYIGVMIGKWLIIRVCTWYDNYINNLCNLI